MTVPIRPPVSSVALTSTKSHFIKGILRLQVPFKGLIPMVHLP